VEKLRVRVRVSIVEKLSFELLRGSERERYLSGLKNIYSSILQPSET